MKTTSIVILAILGGFIGGYAATRYTSTTTVMAQGGFAPPQVYVNGQEVIPVENKINIVVVGPELGADVHDGAVTVYMLHPTPTVTPKKKKKTIQ